MNEKESLSKLFDMVEGNSEDFMNQLRLEDGTPSGVYKAPVRKGEFSDEEKNGGIRMYLAGMSLVGYGIIKISDFLKEGSQYLN
ncbi:MAG: hypothetical protein WDZ77_02550 [Candidatus Pacearchaeota archaeon]